MIPIKVTTDYTLLQSTITISKMLAFLTKYQVKACGICDTNLSGVMEFYNAMTKENIKPLIGLDVTFSDAKFYIYPRNYEGYQELLKINTLYEKGVLTLEDIYEHASLCNVILPFEYLDNYETLKENISHLYVGYTTFNQKNNALIKTEQIIFCPDFKAFFMKENKLLQILDAISKNSSLEEIELKNYEKNTIEYYIKESFEDKTDEFVESINISFPTNKRYIPKYLPEENSGEYLKKLAQKGLFKRLNGNVTQEYQDRLLYELSVISKMGFDDYFLIVYDYVLFAKKNDIMVGVGRGSAVGSLVSYSLGITDIDPMPYHLLFERFLNPDRVTMPDIDIDFEEKRREDVITYVKNRYGMDKVSHIITFGTLKSRLVIRSVGKALNINPSLIDSFTRLLDARLTLKENLQNQNLLQKTLENQSLKELTKYALALEGLKKHISVHAAGVVISSEPLDNVIPVRYLNNERLTGFTMNYLEDLGLLKMDFLVITNLDIIKNVTNLIYEETKQKINLRNINLSDDNVLKCFREGDTLGVFQFDSEGMKNFLMQLKPTSFQDMINAIALYRPGPMDNIPKFIKRKEKKEVVTYPHPDLEPILKETYGIIVYQEQIMQILSLMGGFTYAEADTIRRAMSKKKKDKIEMFREKFIMGATTKGYDKALASEVYELISKFANYGFNKSHSVAYAYMGYLMAYLKCYYPLYFITSILNMSLDSTTKTQEYLALAKRYKIKVLPPDINKSTSSYQIEGKSLRTPFNIIRNLGIVASETIVSNRLDKPYQDFYDFTKRNIKNGFNKKTLEVLIKAGVFDAFGLNHKTLLNNIDNALSYATLACDLEEDFILKPEIKVTLEETPEEKRQDEYESFGFYLGNHPASAFMGSNICKLENIKNFYDKQVICVVLLEKIRKIKTKKNEDMAFITASDETGSLSFVCFPSLMKELENLKEGDLAFIQGRVARRLSNYQININSIKKQS